MDILVQEKFSNARALFPHTDQIVYLNSASYCPMSTPVAAAIQDNLTLRLAANKDDTRITFETADSLRLDFDGLIGADAPDVGIGSNTSHGLNIAAFGLPLGSGDEVLVSDLEFPAIIYAFRGAAELRGFKLKFVPSRDSCFGTDSLVKSITPRTRALAISWVQFHNGFRCDLVELSEVCRRHGMFLIVDGIQGMGVCPIDVREAGVDMFVSGCQKWMLSPQGTGFYYLSSNLREQLRTPFASWHEVDWKLNFSDLFKYDEPFFDSARRYELAYYNVMGILGMKAAVGIFQNLGISAIEEHNAALINRLAEYIHSDQRYRITSSMEPKHRSSIFTFTCEGFEALHRKLMMAKIVTAQREGSIRVSVHLFNNESDIDRLIEQLEDFSEQG